MNRALRVPQKLALHAFLFFSGSPPYEGRRLAIFSMVESVGNTVNLAERLNFRGCEISVDWRDLR